MVLISENPEEIVAAVPVNSCPVVSAARPRPAWATMVRLHLTGLSQTVEFIAVPNMMLARFDVAAPEDAAVAPFGEDNECPKVVCLCLAAPEGFLEDGGL